MLFLALGIISAIITILGYRQWLIYNFYRQLQIECLKDPPQLYKVEIALKAIDNVQIEDELNHFAKDGEFVEIRISPRAPKKCYPLSIETFHVKENAEPNQSMVAESVLIILPGSEDYIRINHLPQLCVGIKLEKYSQMITSKVNNDSEDSLLIPKRNRPKWDLRNRISIAFQMVLGRHRHVEEFVNVPMRFLDNQN